MKKQTEKSCEAGCIGTMIAGGLFEGGEEGWLCVGHDDEGKVCICAVKGADKRHYSFDCETGFNAGVAVIVQSQKAGETKRILDMR